MLVIQLEGAFDAVELNTHSLKVYCLQTSPMQRKTQKNGFCVNISLELLRKFIDKEKT